MHVPEEDIRVGERESYATMGKICTEDTFDSVVCASCPVSVPPIQRPTNDRVFLLLLSTLLGWKVGGPFGVTKDGKSDKSTNAGLERWLSC